MINIQDIIPFMKEGFVAMDKSGDWLWWENEPERSKQNNIWIKKQPDSSEWYNISHIFDIASADDWTRSLIKIDNTAREKFEEEYQNNIQKTIQELKQDD